MPHDCVCPICGAPIADLPVTVLPERGMVVAGGRFIVMPASEMLLLQRLIEAFPRVLTKEAAMEWLYQLEPSSTPESRIIDVFICKLRKKLSPLGIRIDTSWGKGYALAVTERPRVVTEAA